jgi:hypothetical protein
MDIKQEREKVKNDFLKIAESLIDLNNPFFKNINNNSGKSASVTLDRHEVLSKISKSKTIRDFLNSNPKVKCCVLENKYLIMRLEDGRGEE